MLNIGDKAFGFKTIDQDGKPVSLAALSGKKIVLFFYPKDDTPGCTKEACGFRDRFAEFKKYNTEILGLGVGDQHNHKKFTTKYDLPFRLLVDDDHKIAKDYMAWGEKKMYGKSFMGIKRITYIIDEKGNIIKTYPKVSPEQHSEEILSLLKNS